MANTRKSTKRARQALNRQSRNVVIRSKTKTVLKDALGIIQSAANDPAKIKAAYMNAIKTVSKAASKGAIPKGRAARKIGRLTRFLKKTAPSAL